MRPFLRLSIFALCCIVTVATALRAAPDYFTYQGRLTDTEGSAVSDGAYDMTFRIYDDSTAGELLWQESQTGVAVSDGLFNVLLGGVTPLPDNLFAGDNRFLEIQILSDIIAPRTRIVSHPYSFRVERLDGAFGGEIKSGLLFRFDQLKATKNILTVEDSTGDPMLAISADDLLGGQIDFYDPVDSKTGFISATNHIGWIGSRGIRYFAPGGDDTLVAIDPDGSTELHGTTKLLPVDVTLADPKARLHVQTFGQHAGYFDADSTGDSTAAVVGEYTGGLASFAAGVRGIAVPADDYGIGGHFTGGNAGVYANVYPTGTGDYSGITAEAIGGGGTNYGSYNIALDGDDSYGVLAYGADATGTNVGVRALAYNGSIAYGILAEAVGATTNYAGYFYGDVTATGTLSKGAGSFKIDHPLDPDNKYLLHSFVESPDMKNVYDGVVRLDSDGEAVVTLPDYFEVLNRDFRYQLTPVGAAMPNLYVAEKVNGNRFRIAGGAPGMEVSWQVTGIRHDPYAEQNRIPVEQPKAADERGKYLHPEVYGLDKDRRVGPAPVSKPEGRPNADLR